MRRWRRDLVLRAAAELAALQGISADLRSRLLNLCDGLLCARLLRACSGLRIVWLRKLRLFERRLLKLRLRGGWLFDLRQWMLDVRLRASGMFKLRRLCIGHMRRCLGAGDEPGLFRRAGRCSDTELSDAECVVSGRGGLRGAGSGAPLVQSYSAPAYVGPTYVVPAPSAAGGSYSPTYAMPIQPSYSTPTPGPAPEPTPAEAAPSLSGPTPGAM